MSFSRKLRTRLSVIVTQIRNRLVYSLGRGIPVPVETWDSQYENGDWQILDCDAERAHYEAISEFLSEYAPEKSILDVGCGPGVTRSFLKIDDPLKYLGIDLSEEAIKQAKKRFPDGHFLCSDAERPEFDRKFGAIIFNEVVYYFLRPCQTVEEYLNFLSNDGVVVVSMCKYPGHNSIWNDLGASLCELKSRVCQADDGREWTVKVFRKHK